MLPRDHAVVEGDELHTGLHVHLAVIERDRLHCLQTVVEHQTVADR